MPYVNEKIKKRLNTLPKPQDAGELAYVLYQIIKEYWNATHYGYKAYSPFSGGQSFSYTHSYKKIADIIGALETCKQEFYRREAAPYEDAKLAENGDVDA